MLYNFVRVHVSHVEPLAVSYRFQTSHAVLVTTVLATSRQSIPKTRRSKSFALALPTWQLLGVPVKVGNQ